MSHIKDLFHQRLKSIESSLSPLKVIFSKINHRSNHLIEPTSLSDSISILIKNAMSTNQSYSL